MSAITIRDNKEPLVDIKKFVPNVIVRIGNRRLRLERTAYLRRTVAKMLKKADAHLPRGVRFIIGDAWRPQFIQCAIFYDFLKKAKKRFPNAKASDVLREINKYVAPWKGTGASAHMSGGAIDLRLADSKGRKIPMKLRTLSYQENALSEQSRLPEYIRRNRQILFSTMKAAGFTNYPKEYWHWSYGDYQWAVRNKKRVASYGAVPDVKGIYSKRLCPCKSGKLFIRCHGK